MKYELTRFAFYESLAIGKWTDAIWSRPIRVRHCCLPRGSVIIFLSASELVSQRYPIRLLASLMSSEKATALVLKVIEFSETSSVVTLFTREFGKIQALAKGAQTEGSV